MPTLNWDAFANLPGGSERNFEMLCRALIRRHYSKYGQFAALAAQPGVEFHLKLDRACSLGNSGRWYGWQCRWYSLTGVRALGSSRREKIKKAINTTEKVLPKLTDWVLWTREPLTKGDQKWFETLQRKTRMKLHQWTSAEVDEHLSGPADILRSTYFGELVLTPESLADLHAERVAPILERWNPEVHQTIDAERVLRRMLVQIKTWNDLSQLSELITTDVKKVRAGLTTISGSIAEDITQMIDFAQTVARALISLYSSIDRGDIEVLEHQLVNRPILPDSFLTLPHRLRSRKQKAAPIITNLLSDIQSALTLFDAVNQKLSAGVVTVLAEAGCGKTELSAQLTSPAEKQPAGILLYGRDLPAGRNFDDLARKIIIQGKSVPSMEALLEAVNAAGQRAHHRVPIIVDGLNEAEDPRDWKAPLASIIETLRRYPYVLFVCTVRPAFASEAIPEGVIRLEIPDFGHDTMGAIRRYFKYYRINPADAELPFGLLSHPLTLRLFCEVTNPSRKSEVGIEAMPGSLTALFDRYLKQAAERIAELAPRTRRYYEQDVRTAIHQIASALWEQHTRSLVESELRRLLGDDARPWDESIVRALEQESVILRIPGDSPGDVRVTIIFDALAGHIIADAIIARHGRSGIQKWLNDSAIISSLTRQPYEHLPLATDTFRGLVGLIPRRLPGQQLWQLLNEPLRTEALSWSANLEGAFLDANTVKELGNLMTKRPNSPRDLLDRLWHTRGAPAHPLNAEFLDSVLRSMPVADRDLRWTEWVRRHQADLISDLEYLEKGWRDRPERALPDLLRAQWVMWILTSTVRKLRDYATRTLYWFGRGNPLGLFDLSLKALAINDPYVPERLVAASYGIAMAFRPDKGFLNDTLPKFARALFDNLFAKNAKFSTTHILMRDYAKHTIDIALLHNSDLLTLRERKRITPPFKDRGIESWGKAEDRNKDEYRDGNYPFGFDFNNYTIGHLIPKRRNYDFDDPEYLELKSRIWWRIYNLGYSLERFGEIDKDIARDRYSFGRAADGGKIDRYGKKYCWIAYYEIAGYRQDKGLLKSEWDSGDYKRFIMDIDPSFPAEIQNVEIIKTDFLKSQSKSLSKWITEGPSPDISPFTVLETIQDEPGPWVLIDGFIEQENLDSKRDIFIYPRGLLVKKGKASKIIKWLTKQDLGGRWLPEIPEHYSIFAGEIPWCETFPYNGVTEISFIVGIKKKRVPDEKTEFLKDGVNLTAYELKKLFEIMDEYQNKKITEEDVNKYISENKIQIRNIKFFRTETVRKTKEYEIRLPVATLNMSEAASAANPGGHAYVLSKELCESLNLTARPQTFDLYDEMNRRVSFTVRWGEDWHSFHKLIYVRKDLLDRLLQKKRLDLVWGIWGERRFKARSNYGLQEFAKVHQGYKVFQEVLSYKEVMRRLLKKRY